MWLVAKNSFLLSPDLTLIILHIALRNLRVLGSIGPRTSMHIGKNSIEGRAFPYFFIFSSAALAAARAANEKIDVDDISSGELCTDDDDLECKRSPVTSGFLHSLFITSLFDFLTSRDEVNLIHGNAASFNFSSRYKLVFLALASLSISMAADYMHFGRSIY
ncbi:hypothetical protein HELRODRAFT_160849 [Helobdella robusta]|uniref:Uncharacterized protein n=1 Tax=Helobdella robusta TaxID=6412 RepID=T1EQT7_HELRO|nr:hypothetical protein HELRODRAFT_160849 [Helobdella robusta]ESO06659.1 hypothetical protein HELRODRAFT_160849 [Helobdella robusta]